MHFPGTLGVYGNDLCGHLGLGVSHLETWLLSRKARFRQVLGLLRKPPELSGVELYISTSPYEKITDPLDRGNAPEFQIRRQGAPIDYSYQAPSQRNLTHLEIHLFLATFEGRWQTRPPAIPASAILEVRPGVAQGFCGRTTTTIAVCI